MQNPRKIRENPVFQNVLDLIQNYVSASYAFLEAKYLEVLLHLLMPKNIHFIVCLSLYCYHCFLFYDLSLHLITYLHR